VAARHGLLIRPDDLLVLGVGWSGMTLEPGTTTAPPQLVATGVDALLELELPPQHVAEMPPRWRWWGTPWTPLPGPTAPVGGAVAPVAVTEDVLRIFYIADDGLVYAHRLQRDGGPSPFAGRWSVEGPIPNATFRPGAALVALSDGTVSELYAVDDSGRLHLHRTQIDGSLGDWQPADGADAPSILQDDELAVAFSNGAANVFVRRGSALYRWRSGLGFEPFGDVFPNGFTAASLSAVVPIVTWLEGDGTIIVAHNPGEGAGTGWVFDRVAAPPTNLGFDAKLDLAPDSPNILTVIDAVGVLWGATLNFSQTAGLALVFSVGPWKELSGNAQPRGRATSIRGLIAYAEWTGNVTTLLVDFSVTTVRVEQIRQLGDWCWPGSRLGMCQRGAAVDVAAIGADRLVRHAGRHADLSWTTDRSPFDDAFVSVRKVGPFPATQAEPTRLVVRPPAGERVPLTADGVLDALARLPVQPADGTRIELPYGMHLTPTAPLSTAHAARPVLHAGVAEPWRTRLALAAGGSAALVPRVAQGDPHRWTPTLNVQMRNAIAGAAATSGTPVTARRLQLGALGGSLDATGSWRAVGWEHEAVDGRDVRIRTTRRGILYPLGHEATFELSAQRRFDPRADVSIAVLHQEASLRITEAVRRFDPGRREFPFGEAEIATPTIDGLDPPVWQEQDAFFRPTAGGRPVTVPVILRNGAETATAYVPVLFVPDDAPMPATPERLASVYLQSDRAFVPPTVVALAPEARFELHEVRLHGSPTGPDANGRRSFLPAIREALVGLPAARDLAQAGATQAVHYADQFLQTGDRSRMLDLVAPLDLDLGAAPERVGALATPAFAARALSGDGVPFDPAAAVGFDPKALFGADAKLLGLVSLRDVIARTSDGLPPQLRTVFDGGVPRPQLDWTAPITAAGPLRPRPGMSAALDLHVRADGVPPRVVTTGGLTNIQLELAGVLTVGFAALRFRSEAGGTPQLSVEGPEVRLGGTLGFLSVLQDAAAELSAASPVAIVATPTGVTARHDVAVRPLTLSAGVFSISVRGLSFRTAISLPYRGQLGVELGFCSRRHPFTLAVWLLGGGGFLELTIRDGRLTEVVAAIEVGGVWSVDWVVVQGEVHALAGIELRLGADGGVGLTGFLRVGGSVSVLGLVSVSLEVSARITADLVPRLKISAQARIVIEVDLFLVSAAVDLAHTVVLYEEGDETRDLRLGTVSEAAARAAWAERRAAFAVAS
jgi:hypothetical protein